MFRTHHNHQTLNVHDRRGEHNDFGVAFEDLVEIAIETES
jgi:hypothetical protein